MSENIEYLPCRKCGDSHGMGNVNENNELEPFDLCLNCIVPFNIDPINIFQPPDNTLQVKFDDKKFREYYRSFVTHLKEKEIDEEKYDRGAINGGIF